jgi:hypothetical protein
MDNLFTRDDIASISKCCSEYKLLPWIDKEKIRTTGLLNNPNAIHLIEEMLNTDELDHIKLNWGHLCFNPNAIHLVEGEVTKKIDWMCICENPGAIHLIEEKMKTHPDDIYWNWLYSNPGAIHLIEEKIEQDPKSINWRFLNQNHNAVHLIEKYLKTDHQAEIKRNWSDLYSNHNAVHLLDCRDSIVNKLDIRLVFTNPNLQFTESINNLEKDCLDWLCLNPGAIHLIKNLKNINYRMLSSNQSIFELGHYNVVIKQHIQNL